MAHPHSSCKICRTDDGDDNDGGNDSGDDCYYDCDCDGDGEGKVLYMSISAIL